MKLKQILTVIAFTILAPAAWGADALDVWTASDSGTPNNLRAVAYGNGQFVAVGEEGTILTSQDGAKWTKRDSGSALSLYGIGFGGGQFVAVGGDSPNLGSILLTSPDGFVWTRREIPTINVLVAVAYAADGRYVAVGGATLGAATVITSQDGVNWTLWKWVPRDITTDPAGLTGVAYGNGRFVAVFPGRDNSIPEAWTFTSTNGVDWSQNYGPKGVRAVTYGNGQFVGTGGFTAFENRHYIGHAVIYSSTDGINWSLRVDDTSGDSSTRFYGVTYGAGQFVAMGTGTYTSADGIKWIDRGPTIPARAVGYGNNYFISMGDAGYITRSEAIGKLGASLAPNGPFLGAITGVNGQNFAIQSSTNIGEWLDLTSVTISNGIGKFSDPSATNLSRRFYKAMGIFQ